ncbi:MAG TPA: 5,10-methylenetetrahydrofolate reductase [Deltaproteobacteria bacterium]|nr:5,10-methylenetetrahydrofolate reductase [Deltaproteobacteria bacterium]
MIVTATKEIDEIVESLGPARSVHLFGCDSCAQQCRTGGPEELGAMEAVLRERGFRVTGGSIVDETCYLQLVKREYRRNEALSGADAVLVLACGAGVRTVAEAAPATQPVLPALDSIFLASVERVGRFFEGCALCGVCELGRTAAVCPHTQCPKGLLNGPCGGVVDGGMCEVNLDNRCAWIRIYERLRAQGRLHVMRKTAAPKDNSGAVGPRRVVLEHPPGKAPLSKRGED